MNRFLIASTAVLAAALTVAGCARQDNGGARVAAPVDETAAVGPAASNPSKKARVRMSVETPKTATSTVQ